MWSVWSERVQVYLGTGLVLVQRPGLPLWKFEPPATMPLADVLRQVDHALDRAQAKPWRLRVHLSAALCPPVAFAVPAGVSRYQEVQAIAQASAAHAWNVPAEHAPEIVCSLDARHHGLAAAVLAGTQRVIKQWAQGHKGRLGSLQPLWAAATGAKACRTNQAQSVAVLEPDALTVLEVRPSCAVRAASWPGQHEVSEVTSRVAEMNDQAEDAGPQKCVAMAFGREPAHAAWRDGPTVWASHWSDLS